MNHAPLAPSSAARIVACPGSVGLVADYPDEEDEDTRAGDAAHWALAEVLRGQDIDVGLVAPNDVMLDIEMVEAVQMSADHINARNPKPHARAVEQSVANASVHPLNWGTPDVRDYVPKHLYIDDFKYGRGYINAVGNWQLINYAVLTLWEMWGDGWRDSDITVTMTIHQPRCYHRDGFIRAWTIHVTELVPYFERMKRQYEAAMLPNAPCIANTECKHCPARHDCEANAAAAADAEVQAYSSVPLGISPEAAVREWKRLQHAQKLLDSRVSGLEQMLTSTIAKGRRVVGVVNESGAGRTVWNKPQDEVIMLGQMLGADFAKPDTITPLQAVAALKRLKIDPSVIYEYCETTAGGIKLVETANSASAQAFSKQS